MHKRKVEALTDDGLVFGVESPLIKDTQVPEGLLKTIPSPQLVGSQGCTYEVARQLSSDGAEVAGESKTQEVVTSQGHSEGAEVASTVGKEGLDTLETSCKRLT